MLRMYDAVIGVKKSAYPPHAILKAAFSFIDSWYVHIDEQGDEWIVELSAKHGDTSSEVAKEFENELIAQSVRLHIYQKTHAIREILLARAMASSMILTDEYPDEPLASDDPGISEEELESILTDWFERND